jgi:hypothetical protein
MNRFFCPFAAAITRRKPSFSLSAISRTICVLICFLLSTYSHAQTSTLEIYGGYGAIQPFHSKVNGVSFQGVHNMNATVSVTSYHLYQHLGLKLEGGYFSGPSARGGYFQCAPACSSRDQMYYTVEAGPVIRFPKGRFIPFVHALGGVARVNGPYLQPLTWGLGLTGGGGADYVLNTSFLRDKIAVRGQVDYQYNHADYGRIAKNGQIGGVADVKAFKVSGGLVFRFGHLKIAGK